jgi:hypothetical protein
MTLEVRPIKGIERIGFDSNGKEIRYSCIPTHINEGVDDGKTSIGGIMRRKLPGNKVEIESIERTNIKGDLNALGNLAKRYIKKVMEFCSKVR